MTDNKNEHQIWSNYDLDYDDWKDDLEEEYPDMTEQERMEMMYETNAIISTMNGVI